MTKHSDERLMLDSSSLHGRVALSKVGNAQLLLIHPSISVCVCVSRLVSVMHRKLSCMNVCNWVNESTEHHFISTNLFKITWVLLAFIYTQLC